jgi:hypothetical protein
MQDDAIYIEGNMIPSRKIKQKPDQLEKKKAREDFGSFDPNKDSQEARIEEMSRLIRNLKKKMYRFDIENNNEKNSPQ